MTISAPAEGMPQIAPEKKNVVKLVVATSLGNALEWFDISVYAYFAVYLSKAFFPASDPTTSLLLTFGTFGLTFLARPIGGVLLGAYADRHGRKASLLLSIAMMTFGTLAVACMPTFDKIGVLAPLLVIVARLVQGFSAGGEFGSSTAFLVEHMPGRRGFVASWQFASQGMSSLLGSGFGALLSSTLSEAELQTWGWRIPFLFGVLIGPVGLYIRSKIEDADRAAGGEGRHAGPQCLNGAEVSSPAGGWRARGLDRGQLSHHLYADLCGQNAAPAADHRVPRGLCRRHRRHYAQSGRWLHLRPGRAYT